MEDSKMITPIARSAPGSKIPKRQTLQIKKRALLDLLEQIPGRIEMLNEMDRAFVNLLLTGQKFRTIAQAAGVHEATIARRLKKIAARITSNNFVSALSQPNLTPGKMQLLRDYFVDGNSMLKIAQKYKVSYYDVRKLIKEHQTVDSQYKNSARS
jgi:Mor family transcriptional regulator